MTAGLWLWAVLWAVIGALLLLLGVWLWARASTSKAVDQADAGGDHQTGAP